MKSRDRQILIKILEEAEVVFELVEGMSMDQFLADERTRRAVSMTLINIGELVKNLTPPFEDAHPQVPWKAMATLRNVAAHKYQTLRMEDVWDTVALDLPRIYNDMQRMVNHAK